MAVSSNRSGFRRRKQKARPPSALLVTRSGDVWTNFESSRRFAVTAGARCASSKHRLLQPASPQMVEAADGSIWALTANYNAEVLRLHDGHWRTFNAADGLPQSNAVNMLVAADGAIWIATGAGVARLPPGGVRFEIHTRTDNARLSQDPVGRIWVSGSDGSHPITGPGGTGSPTSPRAHLATDSVEIRGAPMFDHEGNLWLATRYGGVPRFADASRVTRRRRRRGNVHEPRWPVLRRDHPDAGGPRRQHLGRHRAGTRQVPAGNVDRRARPVLSGRLW